MPGMQRTRRSNLCALVALLLLAGPAPRAQAAPKAPTVAVLPTVALPGVSDELAARFSARLGEELRGRGDLRVVPLPASTQDGAALGARAKAAAAKAGALAREQADKAAGQLEKGAHGPAAALLRKAVGSLLASPLSVDEAGGRLLAEATLQLAVACALAGDDEGSDAALAAWVRWSPDRPIDPSSYPPAFTRATEAARARALRSARGAVRVLAPAGAGESRVLLDGRPLRAAPALLHDVLPGEHVVRVERGAEAWAERVEVAAGGELTLAPRLLPPAGAAAELSASLAHGPLDRAAAKRAGRLARDARAQALLVGALSRERDGLSVKHALVLAKGDRVVPLAPLALDGELLGVSLEVLHLADDAVARLASPPAEPGLPLALGSAAAEEFPAVAAAPPPPEFPAGAPAAATAPSLAAAGGAAPVPWPVTAAGGADAGTPEPRDGQERPPDPELAATAAAVAAAVAASAVVPAAVAPAPGETAPETSARRVAMPGRKAEAEAKAQAETKAQAEAKAQAEPLLAAARPQALAPAPARNLVIPRLPTAVPEEPEAAPERPRPAPAPSVRMEALEANQVATVREQPAAAVRRNHTALWIVAGALVAGGLGVGGYLLYEHSRSPTSATLSASWSK